LGKGHRERVIKGKSRAPPKKDLQSKGGGADHLPPELDLSAGKGESGFGKKKSAARKKAQSQKKNGHGAAKGCFKPQEKSRFDPGAADSKPSNGKSSSARASGQRVKSGGRGRSRWRDSSNIRTKKVAATLREGAGRKGSNVPQNSRDHWGKPSQGEGKFGAGGEEGGLRCGHPSTVGQWSRKKRGWTAVHSIQKGKRIMPILK